MGYLADSVLAAMAGDAYRIGLLATLAVAGLLSWRTWRRTRSAQAQQVWLGAASLVACLGLAAPFSVLARVNGLPSHSWIAPFDRLIAVTMLVMLGWTIVPRQTVGARWRLFLAGGLAATAIAYVGWAPVWAREFLVQPSLDHDPTHIARMWDAWQVLLAVAVLRALLRHVPPLPRWLLGAPAALAIGGSLELLSPLSVTMPAWSRLGTLGACLFFVAAAVNESPEVRELALPSGWRRRLRRSIAAGASASASVAGEGAGSPAAFAAALAPDIAATQALHHMVAGIGADPAIACLLAPGGDIDVWAMSGRQSVAQHVGMLPLADRPTLRRVMRDGSLRLASSRLARDVDQLYRLISCPEDGPVLLEPMGQPESLGVLLAGRMDGEWTDGQVTALRAIGRHTAAALRAGAEAGDDAARVASSIEAQSATLNRLTRTVESLDRRLSRLEARDHGGPSAEDENDIAAACPPEPGQVAAPPAASEVADDAEAALMDTAAAQLDAAAAQMSEAPAQVETAAAQVDTTPPAGYQPLAERVACYERALERLPWGVVVTDADGSVVFGNASARRLLHADRVSPGRPLAELFAEHEGVTYALHKLAHEDDGDEPRQILLESPRLRLELVALRESSGAYLGAVGLLCHRATEPESASGRLLPAVASALNAPMTSILGYSDLLGRGAGLTDDQVGRFLERIDANLARMQVMLSNLLTVLTLDDEPSSLDPQPVDVRDALQAGVERARAYTAEKHLVLSLDLDDPLPPVSADRGALELILDNLLVNAAHRSPQGGDVAIGAEVRQNEGGPSHMVISVHDRGTEVARRRGEGIVELDDMGVDSIGLAVARLLAERMGGRAWAESGTTGTRFRVRLPVRRTN